MYQQYRTLNIPLEDFINSEDERIILENIRRCSKLIGKSFQVNFWYLNLKEQDIKDFVDRNEKLLFEVNTSIGKQPVRAWFCIKPPGGENSGYCRYYWGGDILSGIIKYLEICKFFKEKEVDEDSDSWK